VADIEHVLASLRWHWDGAYQFGHDGMRYWAYRADNTATLCSPDVAEFRAMIRLDYIRQPVHRD